MSVYALNSGELGDHQAIQYHRIATLLMGFFRLVFFYVASATLPAEGIWVYTLLLGIDLLKLV